MPTASAASFSGTLGREIPFLHWLCFPICKIFILCEEKGQC